MATVQWDDEELHRLWRELRRFQRKAVPYAHRDTANQAARRLMHEARKETLRKHTHRNAYTKKTIQFTLTRSLTIGSQRALAGTVEPYMATQEFGGTKRGVGKHGPPVPTTVAAGEGVSSPGKTRKKAVRLKPFGRRNIQLGKDWPKVHGHRRRRIAGRLNQWRLSGQKFAYMELGGIGAGMSGYEHKGIYRWMGSRKKGGKARIHMVHDMSRKRRKIPPTLWLAPASVRVEGMMPGIFRKQLKRQVYRNRLFTGRRTSGPRRTMVLGVSRPVRGAFVTK